MPGSCPVTPISRSSKPALRLRSFPDHGNHLLNENLSLAELVFHLDVDRGTASSIADAHGLDLGNGQHPWGRVFRCLRAVEPARLPAHLADLTARGVPGIDDIDDLWRALRRPRIDFARMARAFGSKPDTFSKALRQGRMTLPFPTIVLSSLVDTRTSRDGGRGA